jgi:hypothetical protein
MYQFTTKDKKRFWNKVKLPDYIGTDECWEWQASLWVTGYGKFLLNGHEMLSHRIAYELSIGPIPEGMHVLHHCDNPPCVNPSHLFLGTQVDNMHDMFSKNRQNHAYGEAIGAAKLTEVSVIEIRYLYATGGHSQRELGTIFGIDHSVISDIVTRKTWTHI